MLAKIKFEGINENDVPHLRTLGLSKLDRDNLLISVSQWVVHYHKSIDCDIYLLANGEINLFQDEFDLRSYLSLEEKLVFSRLFGSYVLRD